MSYSYVPGNRIIIPDEFRVRIQPYELTSDELEYFEERAAIMQYEGQLSQTEAETKALECVLTRRHALLLAS